MTLKELREVLEEIKGDDLRVVFVYVDPDNEGDAEEGDVLEPVTLDHEQLLGHVLRLKKK